MKATTRDILDRVESWPQQDQEELVVTLPATQGPPIEYIVATARDPQVDTQAFRAFLKSAAAQDSLRAAGLEPMREVERD